MGNGKVLKVQDWQAIVDYYGGNVVLGIETAQLLVSSVKTADCHLFLYCFTTCYSQEVGSILLILKVLLCVRKLQLLKDVSSCPLQYISLPLSCFLAPKRNLREQTHTVY